MLMFVMSLYLTLGAALGALAGPMLVRAARWVVARTRTKRDDAALAATERFLRAHPEVVRALAAAVSDALDDDEAT